MVLREKSSRPGRIRKDRMGQTKKADVNGPEACLRNIGRKACLRDL